MATIHNTKTDLPFITIELKKPDGTVIKTLLAQAKDFSTGSKGFAVSDKADLGDNVRLQCSLNLVIIGSKPQA
jgi:hypothetical protein